MPRVREPAGRPPALYSSRMPIRVEPPAGTCVAGYVAPWPATMPKP